MGAAAALAVGAAGVVAAVQGFDTSGARPADPAGAAVQGFTPWTVRLGAGADDTGTDDMGEGDTGEGSAGEGGAAGSGADPGRAADGGAGQAAGGAGRAGGTAPQPPVCAAHGADLYCTAPGIKAVRLRQAGGEQVWSVRDSGGGASGGAAELFVSGDLLYVVSAGDAALGRARLEALGLGDGAARWGLDLTSYARVVPVGGGVMVVLADGRVRVLDAGTGAERWGGRPVAGGAQWVASRDGRLVFAVSPAADGASTLVTAVDPGDGTVRWRERLEGALSPVETTADGGGLVLLSADAEQFVDAVVRLGTEDGTVRRVPLATPADQAQAAVDGDTVYVVGSGGSLAAVDVGADGAGRERWRLETGAARVSRPVVARSGGHSFVLLSASDGRLLAVDGAQAVMAGQSPPRRAAGGRSYVPTLPAPVVAGGRAFASAPDGTVFAVDAGDPGRW